MLNGKIKEFFIISGGNSGLTEEFIYYNQPKSEKDAVKVYSGSTISSYNLKSVSKNSFIVKNGVKKPLKRFNGQGIVIVRKGRAGFLTLVHENDYTINDDAYILNVKKKYTNDINLLFILHHIKGVAKECVSSSGKGKNATFNKTLFEESYINIPKIEEQCEIAKELNKIINIRSLIIDKLDLLDSILNQVLVLDGKLKKVSEVFYRRNGERVSEESAYKNQGSIPVATAQTANNGITYKADLKWLKTLRSDGLIEKGPCITWAKDGVKAGTLFYRDYIFYASDLCGVLIPKEEYVNKINLKWFLYTQKPNIEKQITSKSTQCKIYKGQMSNVEFKLPDIHNQNLIADEYEKLEKIGLQLRTLLEMCDRVLN